MGLIGIEFEKDNPESCILEVEFEYSGELLNLHYD